MNIPLNLHEIILVVILAFVALLIFVALKSRSSNPTSKINLDDLFLGDDGKMSKTAAVMYGSFITTSWVIISEMLNHTLTDTTFGLYIGVWVVPSVTKIVGTIVKPPATTP